MSSYDDYMNGPETNNIAHGGALSLDTNTNTDDPSTSTLRILENFETAQQASCTTVQNKFETTQQSGQRQQFLETFVL